MADSITLYLKAEWLKLFEGLPVNESLLDAYFIHLIFAYTESHRFYHRPEHLHHLIGLLHESQVSDIPVFLAAFYHDYIYVPGKNDNELKSAEIAQAQLEKLGVNVTVIERVCDLIIMTKTHQISGQDNVAATFLDADMSIIGAPTEIYSSYVDSIRKEFNSVPKFFFNRGRRKFLSALLMQERIFITDWFYEKFETQARENIAWEIRNF